MNENVLFGSLVAFTVVVSVPGFVLFYRAFRTTIDLSRRLDELERLRQDDHDVINTMRIELGRLGIRLERWMSYAQRLAEIMRENGLTVPPSHEEVDAARATQRPSDAALASALVAQFSSEELDDLAFRLGVNEDSLEGDTLERRAMALVRYARRHQLSDRLIEEIRVLRPPNGGPHW